MKVLSVDTDSINSINGTNSSFIHRGRVKVEITEEEFNALWNDEDFRYIEEIPCSDIILKECFCTSVTENISPNLPKFSAEYIFNDVLCNKK